MNSLPSLPSFQNTSADFSPPNEARNKSKADLTVTINNDSQTSYEDCISALHEDPSIQILISKGNLFKFTTLLMVLQWYFVQKRFKSQQQPTSITKSKKLGTGSSKRTEIVILF